MNEVKLERKENSMNRDQRRRRERYIKEHLREMKIKEAKENKPINHKKRKGGKK